MYVYGRWGTAFGIAQGHWFMCVCARVNMSLTGSNWQPCQPHPIPDAVVANKIMVTFVCAIDEYSTHSFGKSYSMKRPRCTVSRRKYSPTHCTQLNVPIGFGGSTLDDLGYSYTAMLADGGLSNGMWMAGGLVRTERGADGRAYTARTPNPPVGR